MPFKDRLEHGPHIENPQPLLQIKINKIKINMGAFKNIFIVFFYFFFAKYIYNYMYIFIFALNYNTSYENENYI